MLPATRLSRLATLVLFGVAVQAPLAAQGMNVPPVLNAGALVTDRLGQPAAFDVRLVDEDAGLYVPAERLSGARPVVLNLGYFGCPGMCGFVLNTFLDRMGESGLIPGRDLDLLTVSVHPNETPVLAKDKRHSYVTQLGNPEWADTWHFITGAGVETRRLADSVGWGFQYDTDQDLIDHPPVIVILSAKGVVTRYLDAREVTAKTLRRAVIEAGEGKVGSFLERLVVTCLTYDPSSGRYEVAAMTIMRVGGAATVLAIIIMILFLRRRELRDRARALPAVHPA